MKFILFIALLISQFSYGQRNISRYNETIEIIRKGDSLEILYSTDSLLRVSYDTLPPLVDNDNETYSWRNVRLVKYYVDQSNIVKNIQYASRKEGIFNFYFDDSYVRKIRVSKDADLINTQFYYGLAVNISSWELIQYLIVKSPEKKEYYDAFLLGKELLSNFKEAYKIKK